VKETLNSLGPLRRWLFQKLLGWAQTYGPYREEALFYVGAAWPTLRRLALELGKRLVEAGTLGTADDVFYLQSAELVEAYTARNEDRACAELGRTAARRRELREARKKLHPPGMVPEKSEFKFGPFDFSAFETQKRNADDSNTLNGFAVSPGKVTGTASVILSPADIAQMKPGTILVCPTTTPAWTPLFTQALGLVTDIGGILAHGSIVAREYGIPAVMGTGNATRRIVSGQQVTVDGDNGTVTILP
jgi:phosphohistidine swiveling domain-containing protein